MFTDCFRSGNRNSEPSAQLCRVFMLVGHTGEKQTRGIGNAGIVSVLDRVVRVEFFVKWSCDQRTDNKERKPCGTMGDGPEGGSCCKTLP